MRLLVEQTMLFRYKLKQLSSHWSSVCRWQLVLTSVYLIVGADFMLWHDQCVQLNNEWVFSRVMANGLQNVHSFSSSSQSVSATFQKSREIGPDLFHKEDIWGGNRRSIARGLFRLLGPEVKSRYVQEERIEEPDDFLLAFIRCRLLATKSGYILGF